MRKFSFRLEKVLNWKNQLEKQKQQELAQEVALEMELAQRLRGLESRIREFRLSYLPKERARIKAGEFAARQQHLQLLGEHVVKVTASLEKQSDQVVARRRELMLVTREKKLLEALRQKQWEDYSLAMEQEERKMMDEIAAVRFHRQMLEG